MPQVFMSYRRADSGGHTGRLYDRLAAEFGADQVVIDIDSIELGLDFSKQISDFVSECDALLAIIGPGWLTMADEDGALRLEDPSDFVRLEIAAALERDVRVVPVLVGGAQMPDDDALPGDIKALALRHGLELSDQRWNYDVSRLVDALRELDTAKAAAAPSAPPPAPVETPPAPPAARPTRRGRGRVAVAAVAVVAAVVVAILILSSGGDDAPGGGDDVASASEAGPRAAITDAGGSQTFEPGELEVPLAGLFTIANESGTVATLSAFGVDCDPECADSANGFSREEMSPDETATFRVEDAAHLGSVKPEVGVWMGLTADETGLKDFDDSLKIRVP